MLPLDFTIDSRAAEPLYAQVTRQLRAAIAAGSLAPGQTLPPVRALAERLRCTPGTVARAYATLQQEGLVVTRRGGGTHVVDHAATPRPWLREAQLVNSLERYLLDALGQGYTPAQIEAAFGLALARWRDVAGSSEVETPVQRASLAFAGSHDLSVEALFRLVGRGPTHPHISATFVGSLGGLMALAEGHADMAGVHLLDETGEYNLPYVRRLLPGQHATVVNLVTRLVGWIVPPDNPLGVRAWEDLFRPGVRIVNRQRGSGTRVLLDRQMDHLGLSGADLIGYAREEATHLGVAQAIAKGEADLGLGIYAAARACGLDFVPLTEEPYDLVIPAEALERPAVQAVLDTLNGEPFRAVVDALGGYSVEKSGSQARV